MATPPPVKRGPKSSKAYRDEAIAEAAIVFAKLNPLNRTSVEKWLIDWCNVSVQKAKPLASLIFDSRRRAQTSTAGGTLPDRGGMADLRKFDASNLHELRVLIAAGDSEAAEFLSRHGPAKVSTMFSRENARKRKQSL